MKRHVILTAIVACAGCLLGLFVGCPTGMAIMSLVQRGPDGAAGTGTAIAKDGKAAGDRTAFVAFVKSHAQDPSGLEVLEFGEPIKQTDGSYTRRFVIRCKLIGYTPNFRPGEQFPLGKGPAPVTPEPVSRDGGTATYGADGKIKTVSLDKCFRTW